LETKGTKEEGGKITVQWETNRVALPSYTPSSNRALEKTGKET